MDVLCLKARFHGMAAPSVGAAADNKPSRNLPWGFTFRHPLRSLLPGRHEPVNSVNDAVLADEIQEIDVERRNWNLNIPNLIINLQSEKATTEEIKINVEEKGNCSVANEECDVCAIDDDEKIEFDRESFSKLLQKVSLAEARLYAQLSYLGCLAYTIPQIKPGNLLRNHGLRFVTSSLEKKEKVSPEEQQHKGESNASADNNKNNNKVENAEVADNENVCEEMSDVADDLNSNISSSSPCEWFVCDDDRTATRFFVIQGSESLASWQANLQFEPIPFEGSDVVLVHRGIYEAAKGMYKQMLPEIHAHLKSDGDHRAKFRFTGHSLGGSLSVLVNLMLLIRGEAPRSSLLLPVVTYGAPSIMCGGDRLLRDLGLPRSHVRSITMHRDIVPRAFSCNYPNRVVELLKAVNGNFRNHPCLSKQKLLYSPMGELLILQPDDTFSPSHDLLPPGGGLYLLTGPASANRIRAAEGVFLNSPHPLEILSDRSAYGPEGNIQRDHDMSSYLKSVRNVIRQELDRTRVLWPPGVNGGGVVVSRRGAKMMTGRRGLFGFSGMVRMGRESLSRFSTLVASQHVHLVVVVLGTYCSFIDFDFA